MAAVHGNGPRDEPQWEMVQHEKAASTQNVSEVVLMDEISTWRYILIMFSFSVGLFLALMDTSIVSTALFTIANEFGALSNVTWLILAYTLTYLGFGIIVARLADVVGRQYTVITCFVIFFAMSLACGFATSLNMLIAFRTIQGIGGSGLYTMCLVVLPEISPVKMLPFVSSLMGLLVAMAGILGPVLGGVISVHNWRWIFWLNAPICVIAFAVLILAWPRNAHGFDISKRRLRDIDFLGCFLLVAASVLFVFGLTEGGVGDYEWSSPVIVCTLLFGCLSAVALFAWEVFVWKKFGEKIAMILPARVFSDRVMVGAIINTICTGFTLFTCVFFIPLRFQIVNLNSPLQAGVHLLPLLGSTAVGTVVGGGVNVKKNNIFGTCVVASIFILVGDVLLSTLSTGFEVPGTAYGYQVITGFGLGMTLSATTLLVPIQSDFRDFAVAQGINAQTRVLGGSIGIAAASAVFNNQLRQKLSGLLTPDQIKNLQTAYGDTVNALTPTQLSAIRDVYASSFAEILRVCAGVAAVGLVATFLLWQRNPPEVGERKAEISAAMEELRRQALAEKTGRQVAGGGQVN